MHLPIEIRKPIASDEAFLYRTWLDSFRITGPMVKQLRDKIFFRWYHKVITNIIARSTVLVAASKEDPIVIYGTLVFEKTPFPEDEKEGCFHWVYVKSTWRRLKVATRLIEASGLEPSRAFFSHWTSCELAINAKREAAKRGITVNWKNLRELKAKIVAEKEASNSMEGDTRVILRKWPELTYNPLLIGSWK